MRDTFLQSIRQTYADCISIVEVKNQDYGADADPFRNFRMAEWAGLTVEEGILLRSLDKMARLTNVIKKGTAVKDESVNDTIMDLINYLAILKAFRESHGKDSKMDSHPDH